MPPGSDTAKARAQAEAKKQQESKGKGSAKGTSKGLGKQSSGKGVGKLPPDFVATPSYEATSIEEKKHQVVNQPFLGENMGAC